jgi:hypothetical protein
VVYRLLNDLIERELTPIADAAPIQRSNALAAKNQSAFVEE